VSAPITTMLIWNGIKIMVIHTPHYFKHAEVDHIELHAENRQKLPVTETGYRSHFCHESHIEPYGCTPPVRPALSGECTTGLKSARMSELRSAAWGRSR
jgi:hypothetical protein